MFKRLCLISLAGFLLSVVWFIISHSDAAGIVTIITLAFTFLFFILWTLQSAIKRLLDKGSHDKTFPNTTTEEVTMKDNANARPLSSNFLIRGWKGDVSLPIAFWVYGVLGYGGLLIAQMVLIKIWATFFAPVDLSTIDPNNLEAMKDAFLIIFKSTAPFTIFSYAAFLLYASVVIWRSANKNSKGFWKFAAKIVVIILMIFFLTLLLGGSLISLIDLPTTASN